MIRSNGNTPSHSGTTVRSTPGSLGSKLYTCQTNQPTSEASGSTSKKASHCIIFDLGYSQGPLAKANNMACHDEGVIPPKTPVLSTAQESGHTRLLCNQVVLGCIQSISETPEADSRAAGTRHGVRGSRPGELSSAFQVDG